MSSFCERVQAQLPELIRDGDDALSGELRAHLAECQACGELRRGALGLGAELACWTPPSPPEDLVERTLAGLALAGARPEPAGEIVPAPRRRSSVEILTTPLSGRTEPGVRPSRGQLLTRLLVQAAAAALLFGVCCVFVAAYYPAVVHALEERRVKLCQEHLVRLWKAVERYEQEHPRADPEQLRGTRLRAALIQGGYADETDFACPAQEGPLGYYGALPTHTEGRDPVVFMDQLGNHPGSINVVYASGRVEQVSLDAVSRLLGRDEPEGD